MYQQGANLKLRVSESSFDQRSNNVNGQQIVARMFGGLDIIYTDRHISIYYDGARRRLFPDRWGTGRAAAVCVHLSDI